MPGGLGYRGFEVRKIDRLGQEIERAAVHRGADIAHIAVSGNDNGRDGFRGLPQLLSPSIRGMLISATTTPRINTNTPIGCGELDARSRNRAFHHRRQGDAVAPLIAIMKSAPQLQKCYKLDSMASISDRRT